MTVLDQLAHRALVTIMEARQEMCVYTDVDGEWRRQPESKPHSIRLLFDLLSDRRAMKPKAQNTNETYVTRTFARKAALFPSGLQSNSYRRTLK